MPSPEPRYFRDKAGNFLGTYVGAEPPKSAIEVASPPAHAAQLWADGAWQPLPPPSYRQRRKDDYAQELGKDPGDYLNTIGDVLDVLIAELYARGAPVTPEFATMLGKVAAIKARHPKP